MNEESEVVLGTVSGRLEGARMLEGEVGIVGALAGGIGEVVEGDDKWGPVVSGRERGSGLWVVSSGAG